MQNEKSLFLNFHKELLETETSGLPSVARKYLAESVEWHGPHPINALCGHQNIVEKLWRPMAESFSALERQDDILMCGNYQGNTWVSAIGHYSGVFERDWLSIPATGRQTPIRFGEFARIEDGKIQEFRVLFDLVAFCRHCGIELLPPDAGSSAGIPAPATGDGVMTEAKPATMGAASLRLIDEMIDGLMEFDGHDLNSMRMERFWTEDMRWYGPAGIGTTYGLDGFQKNHQGPFLAAFPDRYAAPHSALFAEGNYACVTGWPSVVGTHKGEYLGYPATGKQHGMRVMDFWRKEQGLLAENWVLIDMLDLFLQFGYDLLGDAIKNKDLKTSDS